jgi:hypothetical protein
VTLAYSDAYPILNIGSYNVSWPILTSYSTIFLFRRQAVKKSKQFEIQKVVRRLKQASSDATTRDETHISKLESVLVSLRAADIDRLANLAAASVGSCPNGTPTPPAAVVVDGIELLDRKILSANCVSEQLNVMVKAMTAIKTKAERQQQRIKGEQAEEEKDDDDENIKRKEKASMGSGDSDEERSKSSEGESEMEPDEDALQAIEKLLAVKQTGGHGGGSDGESSKERNSEVSSEEDSGVIENVSELEEDMLMDSDFISTTEEENEEEHKGDYMKSGRGSDSNGKVESKTKAKKPKNRLGQRARRQLAGQQQPLYGGRKPAQYRKGQGEGGKSKLFRDDGSGAGGGLRERKEDTSRKRPAEDEGPLHPSWAARRQEKQKVSIVSAGVSLSNKKIVFDDDGSKKVIATKPSSSSFRAPRSAKVDSTNSYHKKDSKMEGEEALHPSWELKKKLANAQKHIQPPRGKKIIFDD